MMMSSMYLTLTKIFIIIGTLELIAMFAVKKMRRGFPWLITPDDEKPDIDREGLKRFVEHGFDPELGWVRKPNTSHDEKGKYGKTSYHIDQLGSRNHPGLEHLPCKIACFGDSFTFARQVNDDETWPYKLSSITGKGVMNYGVGNYGVDQSYLRMKRELKENDPEIVIMGVVPSTIVRILCVWKHYNEFGNTLAFKPRFDLKNGELTLIKNIIDCDSKLLGYERFLEKLKENDYFYETKFRNEMIRFPYLYHTLKNPMRNLTIMTALFLKTIGINNNAVLDYPLMKIMDINKTLRVELFKDDYAVQLFEAIIDKFIETAEQKGAKPCLLFMPQKDDVVYIRENNSYYANFINRLKGKVLTVDMTDNLLGRADLDDIYSDDNVYGGHFSRDGNVLVAEIVNKELKDKGYL
jgi:hypothetical protein